jgi:hypothetical protein
MLVKTGATAAPVEAYAAATALSMASRAKTGGSKPPRSPPVERPQAHRPVSHPFLQQDGRDQEAGENEEDVDAEETAAEPADMVCDDERYRDAAKPVERWYVTEPRHQLTAGVHPEAPLVNVRV